MTTTDQTRLSEALAAIEAAQTIDAIEAQRVAALGKSGWVSLALKTLGAMSPEERQVEGPRIQAMRASVADAIEAKKAALESAFAYAPFDQGVRRAIIYSLLTEDRTIEARVVGASYLAGNGGYACMLRKKFEAFEKGEKAALLKEVKPEHPAIYRDEAAQKAERDRQREEIKSFGCEV